MTDKKLDVCLSPALLPYYEVKDRVVVVIDILRATSTMCVALDNGANKIIPVDTIDEGMYYKGKGYLVGAERNGAKVDGFDLGNSPYEYMNGVIEGKDIVLTTSNGTRAISMVKEEAAEVLAGAFLNLEVMIKWLKEQEKDLLLLCAGWKNKFNLEDSLFAGALVHYLKDHFIINYDAALMAGDMYQLHQNDLMGIIRHSSHYKRLAVNGIKRDIEFCLQLNQCSVIPIWEKDGLVTLKNC